MAEENTSDQKTQDPTPRRLERAFEEGQIAFSSELLSGLILIVGAVFFWCCGSWFFTSLKDLIRQRFTYFDPMLQEPETILLRIRGHLQELGMVCLAMIAPIITVVLAGSLLQTRFNISTKPLEWNWSRIHPLQGWKRIFSLRSVNRGGIAIAKASCIIVISYWITMSRMNQVVATGQTALEYAIQVGGGLLLAIGAVTAVLMLVVGTIDYGFQWWKQRQDLRMTMHEVRDENKETEGDPQIKARIRRIANELSKKRLMQAVPKATVVVTNPTHFAVALRYDANEAAAPVVVAKGADFLAQQIIKIAKDSGVAVVERKPVARYLYFNVKTGQQIPVEIFHAVAEIINFIRQLDNRAADQQRA
jgi:flagellar biosynthesis protein FlhB